MSFRRFLRFWMSFNAFGRIWRRFEASFEVFSDGVCNFYRSNFTIFSWNPRFRAFFLGSSTGFFEKYAAFEALLKYLFDIFVFFTFWSRFGALLMVLWNFVDVFSVIFRFWMSFNAFGRIWRRFESNFEVFSDGVCNFPHNRYVLHATTHHTLHTTNYTTNNAQSKI